MSWLAKRLKTCSTLLVSQTLSWAGIWYCSDVVMMSFLKELLEGFSTYWCTPAWRFEWCTFLLLVYTTESCWWLTDVMIACIDDLVMNDNQSEQACRHSLLLCLHKIPFWMIKIFSPFQEQIRFPSPQHHGWVCLCILIDYMINPIATSCSIMNNDSWPVAYDKLHSNNLLFSFLTRNILLRQKQQLYFNILLASSSLLL